MNVRINSFQIFKNVADSIYNKIDKERPKNSFDEIVAFVVNSALACELGMKAILAEKFIEIKSHKLKILFDKIDPEIKLFIKSKMPSLIGKTENSKEFEELISKTSNTFAEWRYFYERDVSTNWLFLYELMTAIDKYLVGNDFIKYLEHKDI